MDGVLNIGSLETPLVIVTFNYRENVFGFAASSHLRSRDPAGGTGNYGLLDQRFAMQWVQKNIGRFGGDPTRVFLVGQSAGADSVAQHLVRQNSWGGLFHAAGLESGAFYQLQPPTSHDSSCGPTPGNVTVAQQEGRWAAMMAPQVVAVEKEDGATLQRPLGAVGLRLSFLLTCALKMTSLHSEGRRPQRRSQ